MSAPTRRLQVVLLFNKSNPFGIRKDVELLNKVLSSSTRLSVFQCDPLEPPIQCDVCFHLEQPINVWVPWARVNVLIVNPEWFTEAYKPYLSHFDYILCKNDSVRSRFLGEGISAEKVLTLPWAFPGWQVGDLEVPGNNQAGMGFAWFVGGSKNRMDMAKEILPLWRDTYPQLNVFSVATLDVSGVSLSSNIRFHVKDLDETARYKLANFFPGHLCVSRTEGFGYTAAEAESVGAFTILNTIEAFQQDYNGHKGVGWLPCTQVRSKEHPFALVAVSDVSLQQERLDELIGQYMSADLKNIREVRKQKSQERYENFHQNLMNFVNSLEPLFKNRPKQSRPPILTPEAAPPISVITLLYNRKRFLDLACHSIMVSDYPKEKIEWILIDDTDKPEEDVREYVEKLKEKSAPLTIKYYQLDHHVSVGEKRNLGVQYATNEIILMMDDDDHYPETSFRRRVAWLTLHPQKPKATVCTTIACYDLQKAISAVNSPPLDIPLSERISEATLTFYKSWWQEKRFPSDVQVGEGESFVRGREEEVLEIPPQQIIVAFSHGQNVSSRRIPSGADVNPGCFWGFPREFLIFIHGLAGVKVQER
jgi:hypothetical protein